MPNLSDLMGYGRDFAQGASNAIASNVSAPVDGLAWLLRQSGMNIQNPVGGSDWMNQQGLTAQPQNRIAGMLGEAAGGVGPMLAAAKAPQIASGLVKMSDNLNLPTTLNKQAGMILYHGSNDSRPIKSINNGGVFGGLFASPSEQSAASHGESVYRMTIPSDKIMGIGETVPWEKARDSVSKNIHPETPYTDNITDMVLNAKSAFESDIPEHELLHALRSESMGEADWELQRIRGKLGKENGFQAVEMPDEHGTSYLVLPGTSPRPFNDKSKSLFK